MFDRVDGSLGVRSASLMTLAAGLTVDAPANSVRPK